MNNSIYQKFVRFLQEDLGLSKDALAIIQKSEHKITEPIPMVLWKYGLVTLEELDRIYDWLETA